MTDSSSSELHPAPANAAPVVTRDLIDALIATTQAAHRVILDYYQTPERVAVSMKADATPVTQADQAANDLIVADLQKLAPYPIISEESPIPPASIRRAYKTYWLVDPLDGTRGFIARSGDFTVNIALMHDNQPLLGVVGLPTSDEIFVGQRGVPIAGLPPAFVLRDGAMTPIAVRSDAAASTGIRLWGSRLHGSEKLNYLQERLAQLSGAAPQSHSAGSSLKFCRLAEGAGDLYVRLGPTSEWDVAAGHAVLAAAGGQVQALAGDGQLIDFPYNKDSLLNGPFCALGAGIETRRLIAHALGDLMRQFKLGS